MEFDRVLGLYKIENTGTIVGPQALSSFSLGS